MERRLGQILQGLSTGAKYWVQFRLRSLRPTLRMFPHTRGGVLDHSASFGSHILRADGHIVANIPAVSPGRFPVKYILLF